MNVSVKLKRSLIGVSKKQLVVVESLGLKRVGDVVLQPDNDATRGKIFKIAHLLQVEKQNSKRG